MDPEADGERWQIKMFGEFALSSPKGDPVRLPTRKSEGLLAILICRHGQTLERAELASLLWPGADITSRFTNLRQTVLRLKKAVGEESIGSSRTHVWLTDRFSYESDLGSSEAESGASARFMPGCAESWFEERRRRNTLAASDDEIQEVAVRFPIEAFLQLLTWYGEHDPAAALVMMRDHRELSGCLSPRVLLKLTGAVRDRLAPRDAMYGWLQYWSAQPLLASRDLHKAHALLGTALERVQHEEDADLESECYVSLATIEIVRGRLDLAERTIGIAVDRAAKTKNRLLMARAQSISGTLHVHQGHSDRGIEELIRAGSGFENNPFELAVNEALRGLYLATAGRTKEALEVLERVEVLIADTPNIRTRLISQLAQSIVGLQEEEYDYATDASLKIISKASSVEFQHFMIYAHEALAVAAWRTNEKSEAIDQIEEARRLRKKMLMNYTKWDESRLAQLRGKSGRD